MKLNNVIILNRKHLRDFFSFSEFWKKKNEFLDLVNSDLFYQSEKEKAQKLPLKEQVVSWIKEFRLTKDMKLEPGNIALPSTKVFRTCTMQCEKELRQLSPEEAFGVVCLYELMGRKLKQDIYEVLSCLGHEMFNPDQGIIIVQNHKEKVFEQYEGNEDGQDDKSDKLYNVLIANMSKDALGYALIRCGNEQVQLKQGECMRAIFFGTKCLKLLPAASGGIKLVLNTETYATGLSKDGNLLETEGNVLVFASGEMGYLYATDSKDEKFNSHHYNFTHEYYSLFSDIGKDETIVYLELNNNETKCLFLTDKKKVYLYDNSKRNNDNEIKLIESDVIMASFNNNELQTIKI